MARRRSHSKDVMTRGKGGTIEQEETSGKRRFRKRKRSKRGRKK